MLGTVNFPDIAGEDLNRCERVAFVLTQDCEVSKKGCFAASSQWNFADEICDCTLVWVRCEIVAAVRREKAFLYRLVLYELKKQAFFATKTLPIRISHFTVLKRRQFSQLTPQIPTQP